MALKIKYIETYTLEEMKQKELELFDKGWHPTGPITTTVGGGKFKQWFDLSTRPEDVLKRVGYKLSKL